MMLQENISLKQYTTFGCNEIARYFTSIQTQDALVEATSWCKEKQIPYFILGTGSNVLFTKPFEGLIIKMEVVGIKKTNETATNVFLSVGAGENWHHFVSYCVQKGWGGIENLSLIPGTVGASPIQNIGAYGVEVQESIESVTALDTQTNQWITLSNSQCVFGYRNSLFKKEKNRYLITTVQFILKKQHQLRTDYGSIKEILHEKNIKNPSLADLSNAIVQIRTSKLPNPAKLGNAGSFFKNPSVSKTNFEKLKTDFPELIAYPISDDTYKLAAGWLIENCGWKGVRKGNVGCYDKQSLVIVNYGQATGKEIYDFSEEIIQSVLTKFNIVLEREVNIL
jgi:UDP-N-acetylmuramate dehydrogenase